ncbi:MAG: dihydroorotate dehydrogenase [Sedimentisphaerales bacterium]|nr:dihydroorotate dehydrogenase [Sedimentisphaerales bacterium]
MTDNSTIDMSVKLERATLRTPVLTASGTCGYAFELRDFFDFNKLGGFITKSITPEPRIGNPPQRTAEVAAGMLNAIGLANVGLDKFIEEKLPLLEKMDMPVFVNVAGKTIEDYVEVASKLKPYNFITGLELNISCPNVKHGGLAFGTDPGLIIELVSAVKQANPETMLITKLSPNVTDITVTARAAIEAGSHALSMVNTFIGMAINIHTRKPVLGNVTGGLSGPAIKPIALNMVRRVYQDVARDAGVPIIGLGGIASADDAIEFLIAGASAVSIGTNMLVNPAATAKIVDGIYDYLKRYGLKSPAELTGSLIM